MENISTERTVVASRNNSVADLELIDQTASRQIECMVRRATSIKQAASEVVVAGVKMVLISRRDPDAWSRFIAPFGIKCKGDNWEFREIAMVLFRSFTNQLQGDGSLTLKTISRSQICRYGAAISLAFDWHEAGNPLERTNAQPEGPIYLGERIVRTGGVWALARLRAEQERHDLLTSDRPSIVTEEDDASVLPGTFSSSEQVTLILERPKTPALILLYPDGKHQVIHLEAARLERILARLPVAP